MDLQLNNKKALITGSTAGIGHAIAARLAQEGATVVLNGREPDNLAVALKRIDEQAKKPALGFSGDLSSPEAAEELFEKHPDVDILVNNLGAFRPEDFEDISDETWRWFFEVNVLSGIRMARYYLPRMRERDWGRVIFVSSESGIHIPAEMVHYGMTKAAQIAVARGLAESVSGTGITVNSVLPGPTQSRGVGLFMKGLADSRGQNFEEFTSDFFREFRPTSIIQRFSTTDEVATMVAYLSSPLAAATTGAPIRVDGGVVRSAF